MYKKNFRKMDNLKLVLDSFILLQIARAEMMDDLMSPIILSTAKELFIWRKRDSDQFGDIRLIISSIQSVATDGCKESLWFLDACVVNRYFRSHFMEDRRCFDDEEKKQALIIAAALSEKNEKLRNPYAEK